MFSGSRALNLLVVTGLLILMSGTRILCDIDSSMSNDQCCSDVEENGHGITSFHETGSGHASSHHDEEGPSNVPDNAKPALCCSNWYVFTVESVNSSQVTSIITPTLAAITGLPILCQPINNPAYETIVRYIVVTNNRTPSSPLYQSTHSYRV